MGEYDYIVSEKNQKKYFILGNEAIARGVVEAGVAIATTYPGTPSSEVGDVLSQIAGKGGFYFEDSANEIVALEVAAAAAMSGVRSFVFMKHVGLNVASDALMSTSYLGTRGGLVIMSADDPSMFSSQNEQDNRHYGEMARLPVIEPSDPQEAKDYLVQAFTISEKSGSPVLFRTTTRVSHMRSIVTFSAKSSLIRRGEFKKDPSNLVILPAVAYKKKAELVERTTRLTAMSESSNLNRIELHGGGGRIGIVTSGAAYNSVMDVAEMHDLKVDVLKLGFTNPLPENLVTKFIRNHPMVAVVEELDPILEGKLRILAQMKGLGTTIHGKMDGFFPMSYEYSPDIVARSLSGLFGYSPVTAPSLELNEDENAPPRLPVMCPGCPHRGTIYAMELVSKQLGLKNAIYATDIGCYSLGRQKPYNEADYLLCMGSSVGTAAGFSLATDQPIIAFIGDSTFFHAGIPGVVNAVHNANKFTLIVMDNRTTAMTGNQTNPGVALNGMLEPAPEVSIEGILRGAGVDFVQTIDPSDVRNTMKVLKDALRHEGVSAIISRAECALIRDARKKKAGETITPYYVNEQKCTNCLNCVRNFSCPAFYIENEHVKIDPALCDGCGVCSQPLVCGPRAIEVKR